MGWAAYASKNGKPVGEVKSLHAGRYQTILQEQTEFSVLAQFEDEDSWTPDVVDGVHKMMVERVPPNPGASYQRVLEFLTECVKGNYGIVFSY